MSEMPRDARSYYAQVVPIESVRPGYSLVIDRGQGRQLFQVEEVTLQSTQDGEGERVTTFTLTSGPVASGGKPWVEVYHAGSTVTRLLGGGPLEWTNDNHAYRDNAHYHVHKRSDGKWNVTLFSMRTDEPGGAEEKLGDYVVATLDDGKKLAQGLADQRRLSW
jgi:hypothetical protein